MRFRAMLIVSTLLLLAGCGQKGPLYLPQPDQGEAAAYADVPRSVS